MRETARQARRAIPLAASPITVPERLELAAVEVRGSSWTEACASTIENSSAYVVTVISVVPSRTLALVSAYVADLAGETAVTHMRLAPRQRARFHQQVLNGLPGTSHPRACLLDHAAELRGALEDLLDEPVTVEIPEPALDQATRVWSQIR